MGIGDFCTCITTNTVFSKNNAVLKDFKGKCDVKEIYFDFDSIPHVISETIENEINGLRWDCILKRTTSNGIDTIKKYNIGISVVDTTNELNYEKLLENISNINVNEIAINMVLDYICNICTAFTNTEKLEYVYISTDGMPNMSKIFEQQRRKYNIEFKAHIQKNIYKDYEYTLSEQRKRYEANKFSFYRDIVMPQINKPDNIIEKFKSLEFFVRLKNVCPNLGEIEISHRNIPGEGEKKIMEKIVERNNKCNYLIYSPDSDLVMISIILSTIVKGSNFFVLRTNRIQHNYYYDCYNISIIMDNILNEVKTYMNIKKHLDKIFICRDIAFVMSLFGNDFIPKMNTINIKLHHKLLFQTYAHILEKLVDTNEKINYLVDYDNKYEFNWNFLVNFTDLLAESEHFLYIDVYIKHNYNINHMTPYMIKTTIGETLHVFVKAINQKIFNNMKRYKFSDNVSKELIVQSTTKELFIFFGVDRDTATLCTNKKITDDTMFLGKDNINKYNDTITFLKFFMVSHNLGVFNNEMNFADCIRFIFEKFNINKKYYLLKLKSPNVDMNSEYITDRIRKTLPCDDIEITDYDSEIYKLSCKLRPYNEIYNYKPTTSNIGRINIVYQYLNGLPKYDIIQSTALQSCDEYVEKFFNIGSKCSEEKLKITQDYVTGFYWVMNFYMNSNSSQENVKYVSTWAYPHTHSPTLHMISSYFSEIKKNIDRKLSREIQRYQNYNNDILGLYMKDQSKSIFSLREGIIFTEREKFINSEEHWMFINPVKSKDECKISSEYKKLRDNKEIFTNVAEIANKIYDAAKNGYPLESPYNINGDFKIGSILRMSLKKYMEMLLHYNPLRSNHIVEHNGTITNRGSFFL